MNATGFSQNEIKIAKLIFRQKTNREIAHQMNLSVRTIETLRLQMCRKMKVKNSVGVALYALKQGWATL